MKKRYWNEPQMGFRERIYFIEIARGLGITFGVFFRNMWKWVTFRKGALTAYYPEEVPQRLFAQQSRPPCADAAPERRCAMRVLQHVRDRVSGLLHRNSIDRGFRRSAASQIAEGVRDRLLALHLLRLLRGGLPRGRDPHGQGRTRPSVLRSTRHVRQDRPAQVMAADQRSAQALSRPLLVRPRRRHEHHDRHLRELRADLRRAGRGVASAHARRARAHCTHDQPRRDIRLPRTCMSWRCSRYSSMWAQSWC